jgi:toxin ParE1/3/4
LRVRWTALAERDLDAIAAWIGQDNPVAAARTVLSILQLVEEQLTAHPAIGRPGRVHGTRELIVGRSPYVVPYRVQDDAIQVLRVLHAARRWPDKF